MSTFSLKILALICMIADHIAVYIPGMPVQMRWIGRIAVPVYLFCLCEGVDHTSSEKKYLLRLYIGSVLMAVIQYLTTISANIFRTLFVLAVTLVIIRKIREGNSEYKKYLFIWIVYQLITSAFFCWRYAAGQSPLFRRLLPALTGSVAFCEGGLPYIVIGIVIYLTKNDKVKLSAGLLLCSAVHALLSLTKLTNILTDPLIALSSNPARINRIIQYGFFSLVNAYRPGNTGKDPFTERFQWMMFISIIPMLMYNGKKGRSVKWFFYVFYVVHVVILWYIGLKLTA